MGVLRKSILSNTTEVNVKDKKSMYYWHRIQWWTSPLVDQFYLPANIITYKPSYLILWRAKRSIVNLVVYTWIKIELIRVSSQHPFSRKGHKRARPDLKRMLNSWRKHTLSGDSQKPRNNQITLRELKQYNYLELHSMSLFKPYLFSAFARKERRPHVWRRGHIQVIIVAMKKSRKYSPKHAGKGHIWHMSKWTTQLSNLVTYGLK